MKLDEQTKNELLYKLETVKQFLIINNGQNYKLYNRTCPDISDKPDSNIVEYLEDIESIISYIVSSMGETESDSENKYF